ncbi:hypothetical protein BSY18_4006 (plasmid) [Blastomonas sp. RAC04]|nr:hypothetical protein BSY18_4006 [Blastomonas sp. RAC04]
MTVLQYRRAGSFRSSGIAIIQHVADVPSQGARCQTIGKSFSAVNLEDTHRASIGSNAISSNRCREWAKFEPALCRGRLQGRDASHRTRNLDTHLTHMCMQLFRHFSRQRSGSALSGYPKNGAFLTISEAADRQRVGGKP